jgi:hypothetical protein
MIKTKLIASYRVDIYTDQTLRYWFETEYRPTIDTIGIYYKRFIYNINKKCWYHRVWGLIAIKGWVNSLCVYFVMTC